MGAPHGRSLPPGVFRTGPVWPKTRPRSSAVRARGVPGAAAGEASRGCAAVRPIGASTTDRRCTGGSVASPGFERTLTNAAPGQRESMMRSSNPHMAFCDLTNRGYGVLKFTQAACEAEWVAFADVRSAEAPAPSITRMSATPSAMSGPGSWVI